MGKRAVEALGEERRNRLDGWKWVKRRNGANFNDDVSPFSVDPKRSTALDDGAERVYNRGN